MGVGLEGVRGDGKVEVFVKMQKKKIVGGSGGWVGWGGGLGGSGSM